MTRCSSANTRTWQWRQLHQLIGDREVSQYASLMKKVQSQKETKEKRQKATTKGTVLSSQGYANIGQDSKELRVKEIPFY